MVIRQQPARDSPITHLFVDQDSRNGSTCKKGQGLSTGKSRRNESTSSGRTCCSFLAGRQPRISSKSSGRWLWRRQWGYKGLEWQKRAPLRTCARRTLSSAAVHRFSHRDFLAQVASKTVVDSVGAFIETTGGEGEGWTAVERKEGGLSTRHQGMKAGVDISQIEAVRSIPETEPSIKGFSPAGLGYIGFLSSLSGRRLEYVLKRCGGRRRGQELREAMSKTREIPPAS